MIDEENQGAGPPSEPPPGAPPPPPPSQPPPPSEPPPPPPSEPPPGSGAGHPYPTTLEVDYQDRPLNKLTTAFRLFTVIPIAIVIAAFAHWTYNNDAGGSPGWIGVIVLPTLLMIVFREKYPRWWFDFNVQMVRFLTRVGMYILLVTDEYPSTDEEQYVHIEIEYPDVQQDLNRFMPLVKWLLAIPHWVILFFLALGSIAATIYAWFAILFTGRYPRDVFEFVVGVQRWSLRVASYAVLMTTDEYPPFSLER